MRASQPDTSGKARWEYMVAARLRRAVRTSSAQAAQSRGRRAESVDRGAGLLNPVAPEIAGLRVAIALGGHGRRQDVDGVPATLHADAASATWARRLAVPAFTVGSHVFGAENLTAPANAHILRHEIAHVVQAGTGASAVAPATVSAHQVAETRAVGYARGQERQPATPDAGLVHFYGEAGHFYTVYLLALAAGLDDEVAFRTAFFTQMPDEVSELDAVDRGKTAAALVVAERAGLLTGSIPMVDIAARREGYVRPPALERDIVQRGGHALTGDRAEDERSRRDKALRSLQPGTQEFGLAAHAFGDAYAHTQMADPEHMYHAGFGHAANVPGVHDPDRISVRPGLYAAYVDAMYAALLARADDSSLRRQGYPSRTAGELHEVATVIGSLPEDQQIQAIRDYAAGPINRPMDPYRPEAVEDRPFEEFRRRPGDSSLTGSLAGEAARSADLSSARAFMAQQARLTRPDIVGVASDPLHIWGLAKDVSNVARKAVADEISKTVSEVESGTLHFFRSEFGYPP